MGYAPLSPPNKILENKNSADRMTVISYLFCLEELCFLSLKKSEAYSCSLGQSLFLKKIYKQY